jgi:hypothetical protein
VTGDNKPIDPQKALRSIAAIAPQYAQAKANRIYCDEYRKSLKALLMQEAQGRGIESAVAQERDAYASQKYIAHLEALRAAVEQEEGLRWKLVAAEAAVEVWRSQEATNRTMDRSAA